jgi:FkbM family methyltransferase
MKLLKYYLIGLKNLGPKALYRFQMRMRQHQEDPYALTSKHLIHPVTVRPMTSDIQVFYQIFFFDEYRCLAKLKEPKLVIDLGANVGYSSAYFLSKYRNCTVVSVEPDPSNFRALKANLAPYGGRVSLIEAAVWPQSETLELYGSANKGQEWGVTVRPSTSQTSTFVPSVTIPELLAKSGHDRISLLKIDIEGAEMHLFGSNTDDWLPKTDNIVVELHSEAAREVFFSAIHARQFSVSTCDELTVCLGK